jgi:hypothetical protein
MSLFLLPLLAAPVRILDDPDAYGSHATLKILTTKPYPPPATITDCICHLILAQFSVQEQNLPRRITGIEYQTFADGRILLEYHIPSLSLVETQLSHSQSPQPLPHPWPCPDPLAYLHLRTRCTLRHAAGTNLQMKKKECLIIIIVQSAESRQENNRKVRNDVTKYPNKKLSSGYLLLFASGPTRPPAHTRLRVQLIAELG